MKKISVKAIRRTSVLRGDGNIRDQLSKSGARTLVARNFIHEFNFGELRLRFLVAASAIFLAGWLDATVARIELAGMLRSTFMADRNSADPSESVPPPINGWVLALIDFGNRRSRTWSIAVVSTFVAIIGWIDYMTGTRVSLGLFYLIPIILSALWLGWKAGCSVSVICIVVRVGGDLIYGGDKSTPISIFWNRTAFLILYVLLVGLLHALISLQRQLELRVKQRTAALAEALHARDELQRQLFNTANRERSSIGHELHDGLGQHLTATALAAKMLSSELELTGHPAAPDARMIVRMAQEGITQTRQMARGLLLAAIEPEQLAAELEELSEGLQKEFGVTCRFTSVGNTAGLDVVKASHLFYIAHEAARNAVRHARASRIEIELRNQEGILELGITDNGSGPPLPGAKLTGMGLRIMAHRSELIGGSFSIGPGPESGAKVTCVISSIVPVPAF